MIPSRNLAVGPHFTNMNPDTRSLACVLGQIETDNEISLAAMVQAGRKVQARKKVAVAKKKVATKKAVVSAIKRAPTPKAKKAVAVAAAKKTKVGFLSALWGGMGKAVQKGTQVASAFGITAPVEKDIVLLKEIKAKIQGFNYRAKVFAPGGTVHKSLLSRKNSTADALADKLSQIGRQVTALTGPGSPVVLMVDDSIKAGLQAMKGIQAGKPNLGDIGIFTAKNKMARDQFKTLEVRANAMNEQYEAGLKQIDTGPSIARQVATIARETAWEGGGKAVAFAQQAGEIAEKAVVEAGEGVKASTNLLKYAPYIAIGGAALYIFIAAGGPAKMVSAAKAARR